MCEVFQNWTTRIQRSGGCVDVRDSLFSNFNIPSFWGGAIWISSDVLDSSSISQTSFSRVTVSGLGTSGGALYYSGPGIAIRRCCGSICTTTGAGSFVALAGRGLHDFEETSAVSSTVSQGSGTIALGIPILDAVPSVRLADVNFTSCYASVDGSAFVIGGLAAPFAATRLIFSRLLGGSVIYTASQSDSSLTFSNVYNNTGGLVCFRYGFTVDSCIFNNNTRDLSFVQDISWRFFTLSNSVFSGDLPDLDIWSGSGNAAQLVTASYAIALPSLRFCPIPVGQSASIGRSARSASVQRTSAPSGQSEPSGRSESTSASPAAPVSDGARSGSAAAIAVGILVPVNVIVAAAVFAFLWLAKRRRPRGEQLASDSREASPGEGTFTHEETGDTASTGGFASEGPLFLHLA
jgi:hypothetical protein